MTICMDEALSGVNLLLLEALGIDELKRYRSKESVEDRYCVEILRRALIEQTDEAWSVLQHCFSEPVRAGSAAIPAVMLRCCVTLKRTTSP